MKFEELLEVVGDLPLFRGSLLLAGDRDPADVRRQLSRWTAAGKVLQLRRNLYVLAEPWRRVEPHPFHVANQLNPPSYVSLESVLAHHGLIPEAVPVTTSVTTGRPRIFDTPLGRYLYQHIHPRAFFGYGPMPGADRLDVLMADPAKALLDLCYLTPGGDSPDYLAELRLELDEGLSAGRLLEYAERWGKPKVRRTAERILRMMGTDDGGKGDAR